MMQWIAWLTVSILLTLIYIVLVKIHEMLVSMRALLSLIAGPTLKTNGIVGMKGGESSLHQTEFSSVRVRLPLCCANNVTIARLGLNTTRTASLS